LKLDYEINKQIGKGASGDVFKAKKINNNNREIKKEKFAIKTAKFYDQSSIQQLKIEVGLMKISNHSNIVSCSEAYIFQKQIIFANISNKI
jgi:serine/threonine protein kinase